jgi:hypothetical protein
MSHDGSLHWTLHRALRSALLGATFACVLLAGSAWASQEDIGNTDEDNQGAKDLVVSPGQEELISTMLGHGAALPDGCKFSGGIVQGPMIQSTYTCPSGQVVFVLTHPDNAEHAATETEDFAITVQSGAPPGELTDVLASLIRSHETEFAWISPDDDASRAAQSDSEP